MRQSARNVSQRLCCDLSCFSPEALRAEFNLFHTATAQTQGRIRSPLFRGHPPGTTRMVPVWTPARWIYDPGRSAYKKSQLFFGLARQELLVCNQVTNLIGHMLGLSPAVNLTN